MGGRKRQQGSILGEVLALLCRPAVWSLRRLLGWQRQRASPEEIKRFYRSAEWKRLRYAQLAAEPACRLCGSTATAGSRMNVDHIKPLWRYWHLRLSPANLQTLCASCNWGKGGSLNSAKRPARRKRAGRGD